MYNYHYDDLNRLLTANYKNKSDSNVVGIYDEYVNYDKNGNITHLTRYGGYENQTNAVQIDDLVYNYDPDSKNQLKKVVDLSSSLQGFKDDADGTEPSDIEDDYTYDANGNMTSDQNKAILDIKYNHLNLPIKIDFGEGVYIRYTYDASGVKLKKLVRERNAAGALTESVTEYLSGFQYNNQVLQFFPQAEGYIQHTKDGNDHFYTYVYQYKDHLGNIRLNYSYDEDSDALTIINEQHYYPFGLEHTYYNNAKKAFVVGTKSADQGGGKYVKIQQVPNSGYQYKYNGKELQDELGLNWYDYGARNYDASLGRWMNVDPASELSRRFSPYTYALDNPLRFIDPDGMIAEDVVITGKLAEKATKQLDASTSLKITRNSKTGKLNATGKAETEANQKLLEAINSPDVKVNLNATSDNFKKDGTMIIGGTFDGNKEVNGVIEASQTVNPNQMEIIDKVTERGEGVGVMHETLEAYEGALNSPGAKPNVHGVDNPDYDAAHKSAKTIDTRHVEIDGGGTRAVKVGRKYQVTTRIISKGKSTQLFTEKVSRRKYKKIKINK